jgi:carbonic anhydrase/acetyltransferase-like protein (isoleucine patch superfamily)
MPLTPFRDRLPRLGARVYLHPSAEAIGDVELGDDVSLWCNVVLRGDIHFIRIGAGTNLQDGVIGHVSRPGPARPEGAPLVVGERVSVGHGAILHGCTVGDECLIGMGSILLDGAAVGPRAILGAGSLVPEGKVLQGGWLYVGRPVRAVRPLSEEELAGRRRQAQSYIALKDDYLTAGTRSGPCSSI